jgi:hypothetical protein
MQLQYSSIPFVYGGSILAFKVIEMLLKVPKCEIFDRSDFPDFYTIKSLHVGDFGVKIKKMLTNI